MYTAAGLVISGTVLLRQSRRCGLLVGLPPGSIAQWLEQGTHNASVAGSNPAAPSSTDRRNNMINIACDYDGVSRGGYLELSDMPNRRAKRAFRRLLRDKKGWGYRSNSAHVEHLLGDSAFRWERYEQ